jgi:hypothetical protein
MLDLLVVAALWGRAPNGPHSRTSSRAVKDEFRPTANVPRA